MRLTAYCKAVYRASTGSQAGLCTQECHHIDNGFNVSNLNSRKKLRLDLMSLGPKVKCFTQVENGNTNKVKRQPRSPR